MAIAQKPTVTDLGEQPRGEGRRARSFAVVGVGLAAALTAFERSTSGRHQVDLQVYRKGAWAFLHGRTPYGPGLPGPRLPFTYTPFSTVAFAPLAKLPWRMAVVAHTFVSYLALFAVVALVAEALVARWPGRRPHAATVLTVVAAIVVVASRSQPVTQTIGYGQINLVLVALVVVDLLAIRDRWWGGVLIGIATGIKLTPLVFVAYLLVTRRRRTAATAVASAVGTVLVGWALLPGPSARYFLHLMLDPRRIGPTGYVGNQSLEGLWVRATGSYLAAKPFFDLSALVVLVLGLWLAREAYRRWGEPYGLAVTALAGLLVSPISWDHHWVWWVVLAMVGADLAWRLRSGWMVGATVAWAALFLTGPIWWVARSHDGAGNELLPAGSQQLLGDAYVLAGLAVLGVAAIAAGRRAAPRFSVPRKA